MASSRSCPRHLHLARLRSEGGSVIERVFVQGSSVYALEPAAASRVTAGSGLSDYVRLGVEHIATGTDHLVFLLALLLLGASFAEVAMIVTGFTVAHSVTLALGVLGVVRPLSAAIESLIGLSIAIVALENFAFTSGRATRRGIMLALGAGLLAAAVAAALGALALPASALLGVGLFALCSLGLLERVARPARLRWLVAFVFGLVHGFGFAGVLVEIGLPPGRLAAALFGFNLGVELGSARDRRDLLAAAADPAAARARAAPAADPARLDPDPRRGNLLVPEPGVGLTARRWGGRRDSRRGRAARACPRPGRRRPARAARSR